MPFLHPDKLVGVARAINQRPARSKPSTEQAAIRSAAGPRQLTPPAGGGPEAGTMLEKLAFRLRDDHWDNHMDRLSRPKGQGESKGGQAKSKAQPTLTLTIGAEPPKPNA